MSGAPEAVRFVTEACGAEALEAPKEEEEEEEEEEEDECAAFQKAESARQEQEMNARINASIQKSRQRTMDSMSEQRAFMSTLPEDCSMRASLEDQHRTLRGMMGYHSMFEQMLAPSGSAPQALGGSNPFGSGPVPQTSRAGFGGGFGGGRACGGTTRPSSVVEPPEDPEKVAKAKRKRVEYEAATQSTRVAEKISRAKRLRTLSLESEGLFRVPAEVDEIAGLRAVDLTGNLITALPSFAASAPCLKQLLVPKNRILTLPPGLNALVSLTKLDISGNQVATLPDLSGLKNLRELLAAQNKIHECGRLPDVLRILNLAKNKFTTLPQHVATHGHLTSLDVSDNPLALLFEGGEERAVPAKLAALHVSGTALATLPAALFRLSDFRTLTLTGTPLATSLLKVDGYEEWAKKQR